MLHTKLLRLCSTLAILLIGIVSLIQPAAPARAAGGIASAIFDLPSVGWLSVRNMTGAQHQAFFDAKAAEGTLMMIDAERLEIDGTLRISSVWQTNSDGRGWVSRSNLTSDQFSEYWAEYLRAGMRLIDQDVYQVDGQLRYAGIWIENKEGLEWASYRNQTSQDFSDRFSAMKDGGFILVDVEVYDTPAGGLLYAQIWVKNTEGLGWAERRNMTAEQYADYFKTYADAGYRVLDLESYLSNGTQLYAAIWLENKSGRGWYAYRDMSAQQYSNRWFELRDAGYRLIDFEIYDTASGPRYAGVWRQNSDRPQWQLKDEINALVEGYVDQNDVAGLSVAITQNGKFVYLRGFGKANIALNRAFHSGTIARAASGCKAVAGVLALRLDQQGLFDVDLPTRDYVPSLPALHTHSVAQLVTNRSGVRHYQNGVDPTSNTNVQYDTALAASALFSNDPLLFVPGSAYGYSTHGYTLLGAAIEGELNKPIAQVLDEQLRQPFNLPTLRAEDRSVPNSLRAALYKGTNSGPEAVVPDNISWKVLGGGCEVSAYDYARMGLKLLNGSILGEDALDRLWTRPNSQANYAFGWNTGTDQGTPVVAKNGAQTGASSYIRIYPEKGIVITILSNQRGHDTPQLGRDIGTLMLDAAAAQAVDMAATAADGLALPAQAADDEQEPAEELGSPELGVPQLAILPPTATDDATEPAEEPFAEGSPSYTVYLPLMVR